MSLGLILVKEGRQTRENLVEKGSQYPPVRESRRSFTIQNLGSGICRLAEAETLVGREQPRGDCQGRFFQQSEGVSRSLYSAVR